MREGQTAGDAFATTQPIVDEWDIMASAYQLGPADSPLMPGNWYAWRVQAYDEDELGLLKNEGWSEMRLFQYGVACTECGDLLVETVTPSRVELAWTGRQGHMEWEVRHRPVAEEGQAVLEWTYDSFLMERGNIRRLSPAVKYEFQVRGKCGAQEGEWSASVFATTGEAEEKPYICEGGELIIRHENMELYSDRLKVGDTFRAADFLVTVSDASLAGSKHSGIGVIQMQALNSVKFWVEFEEIELNTDFELIAGDVHVTGSSATVLDPVFGEIFSELQAILEIIENIKDNDPDTKEAKEALDLAKQEEKEAEKAKKEAERQLKEAEAIDDEQEREKAIAEAQEALDKAKQDYDEAKDAKSQASNNVLNAIVNYMGSGSKDLLSFISGVNRCIIAEPGLIRQQEAERTNESGKKVLTFLATMDQKSEPGVDFDVDLREFEALSEEEALIRCMEMGEDVKGIFEVTQLQGSKILATIQKARTAVYLFQQIFGLGYDMLADDDALREGCENWATEQSLTFSAHESTGFDAGGRGFDNDVFDAVKCGEELILYPFIAIEKGQNGKIKYDTDATETVYFRPVDAPAKAKEGDPQGTELYALDNKKTLWEAYQTIDNQEQVLGKVNVLPFEPKTIKLYIKPVDDTTPPSKAAVESYLASVYGPYFIKFEVEILPKVSGLDWDENGDGKLASGDEEHGNLANYTSEQSKLIAAFKKVHNRGKDELVAFWAPTASKSGLAGFFPQGRAYGFLYAPDNSEQTYHTLAHELGHGAFNLQHPFKRFEGQVEKGATDNLMDYSAPAKALYAYQWNLLHQPLKVLGIENEDGESESQLNPKNIKVKDLLAKIGSDADYAFFLSGRQPEELIPVHRSAWVSFTGQSGSADFNSRIVNGAILSFQEGEHIYVGHRISSGENHSFRYHNYKTKEAYSVHNKATLSKESPIFIGIENVDYCKVNVYHVDNSNALPLYNNDLPISQEILTYNPFNLSGKESIHAYYSEGCELSCEDILAIVKADPHYGPLFESHVLKTAIENNPCVLQGMKRMPEGLGYETAFMEELRGIMGDLTLGATAAATTAVILPTLVAAVPEGAGTTLAEWLAKEEGKRIAKEAVKESMIDLTVQMALNMIIEPVFSEEPLDSWTGEKLVTAAWDNVDWTSVITAYPVNKASGKLAGNQSVWLAGGAASGIGCFQGMLSAVTFNGTKPELKDISLSEGAFSCVVGAVSSFISFSLSNEKMRGKIDALRKKLMASEATQQKFFQLCRRLGISDADKGKIETLLKALGIDELNVGKIMKHFCFPAGTMIYADGQPFKVIEDIVAGDYVDAQDHFGNIVKAQVTGTTVSYADSLIILLHGEERLLACTPNHRIFTPAGYRRARDLIEGDSLLRSDGAWISVSAFDWEIRTQTVYNFEVAEAHSYFAEGYLVHNKGCGGAPEFLYAAVRETTEKVDDFYNLIIGKTPAAAKMAGQQTVNYLTDNLDKINTEVYTIFMELKRRNFTHKKFNLDFINEFKGKALQQYDEVIEDLIAKRKIDFSSILEGLSDTDKLKKLLTYNYGDEYVEIVNKYFKYLTPDQQADYLRRLSTQDLSSLREQLIKDFNQAVGKNCSYEEVSVILTKANAGSKGAIAEAWVAKKLGVMTNVLQPNLDLSSIEGVFKKGSRRPDGIFSMENGKLVIYDVKAGYADGGIDLEQLADYAKMVEIFSNFSDDRFPKLIGVFEKAGIDMSNFAGEVEMRYIVMPGLENKVGEAVDAIKSKINAPGFIDDKFRKMFKVIKGVDI
ncbi:hypothetical protein PEDI_36170 [Persicobacter diffluens]|uniref:Fibronectin type-III domain-containing protein n=1 Tax=Persicobacter diffluens TaxID=981 RepID=A0AAN4W317_9BACT|nr:hypothetical protein PEDI_36170 [Persicobacter diffluens]